MTDRDAYQYEQPYQDDFKREMTEREMVDAIAMSIIEAQESAGVF